MQRYIDYINQGFSDHSHADIAKRVLVCLDYIEKNIDSIAAKAGKSDLFRHPENHLAVHLSSYHTPNEAKTELQKLINELKGCFDYLASMTDEAERIAITRIFLQNIVDSEVGCMEARVKDALYFMGMYKTTGVIPLDQLMAQCFTQFRQNPNTLNILDYFHNMTEHYMPVRLSDGSIKPISWAMIKTYLKDTLAMDTIDEDWHTLAITLKDNARISYSRKWAHYDNIDDQLSAERLLSCIKSYLMHDYSDLANASVKTQGKTFSFSLTHLQHQAFLSILESKPKPPKSAPAIQPPVLKAAAPAHRPIKKTHKCLFDETIDALLKLRAPGDGTASIEDWQEGQAEFIKNHPKAWRDRGFVLRHYFSPDLVTEGRIGLKKENHILYCFYDKIEAEKSLYFLRFLFLTDLYSCYITIKEGIIKKEFHGIGLTSEQYEHLETLRQADSYVKSIRWDEKNFIGPFVQGITPSKNTTKPKLRFEPRKPYTVYGHGVVNRQQKKFTDSPFIQSGQVSNEDQLKKMRSKRSRQQSTSLITQKKQSQVFGFNKDRQHKLAGFIFAAHDAYWKRLSIYDGGTVDRPFDFLTENEAKKYHTEKTKCMGMHPGQQILFADINSFKQAINADQYNEVLNCLRFDINTTSIGIFSDTFEARCIAQLYARIMRKRLEEQYRELNKSLDPSYQVPIIFYLPGNKKNWHTYKTTKQVKDRQRANTIFSNPAEIKKQFTQGNFEFLFLIDQPDDIFNITHQGKPVIMHLFSQGLYDFSEALFNRTSQYQDQSSYFNYLKQHQQHISKNLSSNTHIHCAIRQQRFDLAIFLISLPSHKPIINYVNHGNTTLLHDACQYGNAAVVRALLQNGADVQKTTYGSNSPLHLACKHGNAEMVRVLLQHNASVTARNATQSTPFLIACENNNMEMVRALLEHGADPMVNDQTNTTPIQYAKKNGNTKMVRFLLSYALAHGKNVSLTDSTGWTLLHYACELGDFPIIESLLEKGADPLVGDKNKLTPLHLACQAGNDAIVRLLFKKVIHEAPEWDDSWTPLHFACRYGDEKMVGSLLKKGAYVDAATRDRLDSLILLACRNSNNQVPLLLLRHRRIWISPLEPQITGRDDYSWTALHYACLYGTLPIVHALLENGAYVRARTEDNLTPLHLACQYGNDEIIQALLEKTLDVPTNDKPSWLPPADACRTADKKLSPLLYACRTGDEKMMGILLAKGVDVNAKNGEGITPLHYACRFGTDKMVRALLEKGAEIEATSVDQSTPLHYACQYGSESIVRSLIEKGANVDAKTITGFTPFHYACMLGREEIIRVCLQSDPSKYDQSITPLHYICQYGDEQMIIALFNKLKKCPSDRAETWTALHHACFNGNEDYVRLLLERNIVDVNSETFFHTTPLHLACQYGDTGMVQALLSKGADASIKNFRDELPLHFACKHANTTTVLALFETVANVPAGDNPSWTPLHYACAQYGDDEMVRLLLERGEDVNAKNSEGLTPLHYACRYNNQKMVQTLLAKGANVRALNRAGLTPLHLACLHGSDKMVRSLFVKLTKDAYRFNWNDSWTLLHLACRFGDARMVQALLKNSADVHAKNNNRSTPLHLACRDGDVEMVQLLLENGADLNAKNIDGWTPLHIASRYGSVEIVRALLEKGANIQAKNIANWTPLDIANKRNAPEILQRLNIAKRAANCGSLQKRLSYLFSSPNARFSDIFSRIPKKDKPDFIIDRLHCHLRKIQSIHSSDPEINKEARIAAVAIKSIQFHINGNWQFDAGLLALLKESKLLSTLSAELKIMVPHLMPAQNARALNAAPARRHSP